MPSSGSALPDGSKRSLPYRRWGVRNVTAEEPNRLARGHSSSLSQHMKYWMRRMLGPKERRAAVSDVGGCGRALHCHNSQRARQRAVALRLIPNQRHDRYHQAIAPFGPHTRRHALISHAAHLSIFYMPTSSVRQKQTL
jgi:hypothetical protein